MWLTLFFLVLTDLGEREFGNSCWWWSKHSYKCSDTALELVLKYPICRTPLSSYETALWPKSVIYWLRLDNCSGFKLTFLLDYSIFASASQCWSLQSCRSSGESVWQEYMARCMYGKRRMENVSGKSAKSYYVKVFITTMIVQVWKLPWTH